MFTISGHENEHDQKTASFPRSLRGSSIPEGSCTSCLQDSLCGSIPGKSFKSKKKTRDRQKRSQMHTDTRLDRNAVTTSTSPQTQFPNGFPDFISTSASSSTCDTHIITSRIPFFWRSHPNLKGHLQKQQKLREELETQRKARKHHGNVKELFEQDRIKAFDEAKIVYSPTNENSLTTKPSDEHSESLDLRHKSTSCSTTTIEKKISEDIQRIDLSQQQNPEFTTSNMTSQDEMTTRVTFVTSGAISSGDDTKNDFEFTPASLSSSSSMNQNSTSAKSFSPNSGTNVSKDDIADESSNVFYIAAGPPTEQLGAESSHTFAQNLAPQLDLFPECKEKQDNSIPKHALKLSSVSLTSNDWVSFSDFPES